MFFLLWSNLVLYFKVEWSTTTTVDQSYDRSLRVNFNLTMHRMPCRYLAIDIQDALGASVLNITTGTRALSCSWVDSRGVLTRAAPRGIGPPSCAQVLSASGSSPAASASSTARASR